MGEQSWWQESLFESPRDVVIELRFETVREALCWWQLQVYDRHTKELLGLEAHPIRPDEGSHVRQEALALLEKALDARLSPF